MIDDRFYRYDAAHEYDEKIRRSADAYLENLESRASVDSKMRVWCNVFLKANVTAGREENGNDGGETTSRGQEPRGPRPSAYLADADLDVPPVLGTALDTVMGFKERTGQQDVLQRAAVMLIGARMGEAVAQSADPATLDLAITMLGYGDGGGWSSFQNTFLLTAMADDTLRVGWIDALGRVPQNIDEYLRSFVTEAESSGIQQEVEECRHSRNPYRVWSERPQELMTYDDTFLRLRLLEMLDITAWTQALDQLPHPSLINSALLFSNVRRDREAIAASLGIAKLIFDEEGGWNHNIAVLFLTKTILTHASDLHSHLRECAQIQDRDPTRRQEIDQQIQEVHSSLPEWFRKAFGVLVKRPDGEEIAIEFLAELIDRFSREKVKMQSEEGASEAKTLEPWSPTYAALEALGGVLREHGASIDDFRRVWENHEQSYMGRQEPLGDQEQKDNLETGVQVLMADGLPFLLGAILHVENSDPQPESEAESEMATKLWSWFEQLLVGRDPALQALANPYSEIQPWIPFTLGRVLAWLPDPAGAWRESWSALDSCCCAAVG